jgi:hypothetical protein
MFSVTKSINSEVSDTALPRALLLSQFSFCTCDSHASLQVFISNATSFSIRRSSINWKHACTDNYCQALMAWTKCFLTSGKCFPSYKETHSNECMRAAQKNISVEHDVCDPQVENHYIKLYCFLYEYGIFMCPTNCIKLHSKMFYMRLIQFLRKFSTLCWYLSRVCVCVCGGGANNWTFWRLVFV